MKSPSKWSRKTFIFLIVGATLAAGGGYYAYSKRKPKPTEIEVATVGREDLQAKVTANGKVQAQKKVDISATIPGQVTHLAVKEGDRVRKGQLLLQIDAVNPRAAARSTESSMQALLRDLESAAASLAQAKADLRARRGELRGPHHPRGRAPAGPHRGRRTAEAAAERRPAPRRAGARHPRRRAGHPGQDHGARAHGRHRHRQARRGGRGRGGRRPEPARAPCS